MKNLLNISNLQSDDLLSILNYSKELNSSFDSCLRGKNIGLIFEKIQHELDYHLKLELINLMENTLIFDWRS